MLEFDITYINMEKIPEFVWLVIIVMDYEKDKIFNIFNTFEPITIDHPCYKQHTVLFGCNNRSKEQLFPNIILGFDILKF